MASRYGKTQSDREALSGGAKQPFAQALDCGGTGPSRAQPPRGRFAGYAIEAGPDGTTVVEAGTQLPGQVKRTVVPRRPSDSMATKPSRSVTSLRTSASPMPLPSTPVVVLSRRNIAIGLAGGRLVYGPRRRWQRWVVLDISTNMPAASRLVSFADDSRRNPHLPGSHH